MKLKNVVALAGAVIITGTAMAQQTTLIARTPVKKSPDHRLVLTDGSTGRLSIKFEDTILARAIDGGVASLSNRPLTEIERILDRYDMRVEPLFKRASEEKLQALRARAAAHSGKAQPDLGGMMYVTGPFENLEAVAIALNNRSEVEYVHFEAERYLAEESEVSKRRGVTRQNITPYVPPASVQGVIDAQSEGGPLAGCDDCGDAGCGDCFDEEGSGGTPNCDNEDCCDIVCDLEEFCCNDLQEWDEFCASTANMVCITLGGDPCAATTNGSPMVAHPTPGCVDAVCCASVCGVDPNCCTNAWDTGCVALATVLCTAALDAGVTGDLSENQGYLTAGPYAALPGDLDLPDPGGNVLNGFNGAGYSLYLPGEPFTDDNDNGWWDVGEAFDDFGADGVAATGDAGEGDTFWTQPAGLWGFAEQLLRTENIDGMGDGNTTRGAGAKVAVIAFGYYEDHEDLDVTTEPGQRLFGIPVIDNPSFGTAVLGIIGAVDQAAAGDTALGMVGMIPEADLYFYPLTSLNDGPREGDAWLSAMTDLDPGDAICAPYALVGGNVNVEQTTWTLIRLASDLDIMVSVAAGDQCLDLTDSEDFGDSGGMVCGGSSPGTPHYRLQPSNFNSAAGEQDDNAFGNRVHLHGWGRFVATLGIGDLFLGQGDVGVGADYNRSYTGDFGGTAAAAAQVTSSAVALQAFARQFYGLTLAPETIRRALQTGDVAPTLPANRFFGGFDDGAGCALDTETDEGPNYIGAFTDLAGTPNSAASQLVSELGGGFGESPLVRNVLVIRGDHEAGNVFSIRAIDELELRVKAIPTDRDTTPGQGQGGFGAPHEPGGVGQIGLTIPEVALAEYLIAGDIADVLVVGESDTKTPNILAVQWIVNAPPVITFLLVEAFDWRAGRWEFLGIQPMVPGLAGEGEEEPVEYVVNVEGMSPNRFLNTNNNRILVRGYSVGFPGFGGQTGPGEYSLEVDFVNINLNEPFGEE